MHLFEKGVLFTLALSSFSVLAEKEEYVDLGDTHQQGRKIWIGTCASCHGYGIAGAPIPMKPKDWSQRVNTPVNELYSHAINGFFGKKDTYMPPRGGNDQLSDTDITLAVDYMLALAMYYINQEDNSQ